MNEKIRVYIILVAISFLLGAGTIWFISHGTINEYKDRLAAFENTNTILTAENNIAYGLVAQLTDRLERITGRIAIAQGIAGEIGNDLDGAKDTVDRIIRRIELLESALSVIFENWQD